MPKSATRALFDLSERCKFRLRGADVVRYLNGQITNDLRKATGNVAIHACVLNAKGKINANVYVHRDDEAFLLDSDPGVRETLAARLERYIIADDVEVEDVTGQFALFHVTDSSAESCCVSVENVRLTAKRFGQAGLDIWVPTESRESAWLELSAELTICDNSCAETLRIERGIPRWGHELSEEIIPIEANLEDETIDYEKGCYIGQEVISRMKMSGQTNKRLCGFETIDGAVEPGMRLCVEEGKEVGWITSMAQSTRLGRQIALGFVKRGYQTPGSGLTASSSARVRIVALPFA